ncbi:MAG: TIGR00282 family metallophosphoesterase [Rhodospirillaceae bacterium]|mgnify:FL=1|nr:TIGR00282 family metallophosphoesterase [Rhodospirillaceae bacterium]
MRLLMCGDVVGRSGRKVVTDNLKKLRERYAIDFVIVNGENAAGGFGITPKICNELFDAGADAITTGNHVWDQRDIIPHFDKEPRLLRPDNFPKGTPGKGIGQFTDARGRKIIIMHLMARLFMDPLDDPFAAVTEMLNTWRLGRNTDAIVLDFHGEASSEKMAMGHFLDGRVSVVVGTHTHIPTADAQVLLGGTGYMTDIGMCGDYDSVIGIRKEISVERFVRKMPTARMEAAQGNATMCAVLIDIDDATGLTTDIRPVRIGGRLREELPE